MEIYVIIILCVATAMITVAYSHLRNKYSILFVKASECDELHAKITQYKEAFAKVKDAAESFIFLRQSMKELANIKSPLDQLRKLRVLLEEQHILPMKNEDKEGEGQSKEVRVFDEAEAAIETMSVIRLLQGRIANFLGELHILGLGDEYETKIRTDLLELAFMMMDVIDSIDNSNYIPSHQGINLRLLKEEITAEEASQMAQPVTDDDRITSQWPRTLHKCLSKWAGIAQHPLIEQKTYLLNGYKFEFYKEFQHH